MGGEGGGSEGWGSNPDKVGAQRVGPRRVGGPKFRAFFFTLPPQNSFLSSLSGGLLVEFWWCFFFKRRGAQMCTFGVLWLSREAPTKPPGFHTTTREPKRADLRVPAFKHHQNSTKGPPREGEKNENCGGRGKKKSEILGGGEGRSRGHRTPMDLAYTCVKHQRPLYVCQGLALPPLPKKHQMRLYVCHQMRLPSPQRSSLRSFSFARFARTFFNWVN